MQLMFECERHSEILWNRFESVVNDTLQAVGDERNKATRTRMHAYIVMYIQCDRGCATKMRK
jgi:hypothetical protein